MEQEIIAHYENKNENTKKSLMKAILRNCTHPKCKYTLRLFLEELKTLGIWNPINKTEAINYIEITLFNHSA